MAARKLSAVERRCADPRVDPAERAASSPRTCQRCGTVYLDYPAGHDAHMAVFGHGPQRQKPVDDPPESGRRAPAAAPQPADDDGMGGW